MRFVDRAGNTFQASASITVFIWSGSVLLNGGAASATLQAATATLSASNGGTSPVQMQLSWNGTTFNAWEAYVTTRNVTLPNPVGVKTLSARFKDASGNISPIFSDDITLTGPTITSFTAAKATITAGQSTTLTGVFANGTGAINNGVGAVTSGTAVTVTPSVTTTYTLTVTNSAGTVVTQTLTVTVTIPSPVITGFTASNATITSGSSTTLTGSFTGGTGSVNNGVGIVTSGTAVTVTPSSTTIYTLTVANAAGTTVTKTAIVTVVAAPVIVGFLAANPIIASGSSATLTAIFTGGTGAVNNGVGTVTSGAATTVTPAATTTYTLTVTNAAGVAVTQNVTVTVVTAPVINSFIAAKTTILAGSGTTLTANFSGGTGTVDNGVGSVTSGNSVTVVPVSTMTYTLTVTNSGTSVTKAVTVNVIARLDATITAPGSLLEGAINQMASVPPQSGCTYFWSITNGTITSPVNLNNVAYTVGAAGVLTLNCTVTNALGDKSNQKVDIPVNPLPNLAISAKPLVSTGDNLLASIQSQSGATYVWSITGGTLAQGVLTLPYINYIVTANDTCTLTCAVTYTTGISRTVTCIEKVIPSPAITSFTASKTEISVGDSVTLSGVFTNGNGTIDNGVGQLVSGVPLTVSPTVNTTYNLYVTNPAGSRARQWVFVNVDPPPCVTISATSPVSAMAPYALASVPSQTGATYVWTVTNGTIYAPNTVGGMLYYTPTSVGTCTLTCKVTNAAGISATGSTTVTVIAAPVITSFTASNTSIMLGGSVAMTPLFSLGTGVIDHGVGPVTSGNPVTVSPAINTTYTLTVTNAAGTTTAQSITLNVNNTAAVPISAASPVTTNATYQQASAPYQSGATYAWAITNGTIQSGYEANYYIYYTPGIVGTCTLSCKVTTTSGSLTGSMTVNVIAAPTITSFTSDKTDIVIGGSATLTPVFTNGTAVITCGSTSTNVCSATSGTAVTVSPTVTTNYTLTVTNTAGTSTSSSSVHVTVDAPPVASITASSPVTSGVGSSASVPNQAGAAYLWTITNGSINGSNSNYQVFYYTGSTGTCTLTCTVTTLAGSVKGTATVQLIPTPAIASFTASYGNILPGSSTTITPIFTGGTGVIDNGIGPVTSGMAIAVSPAVTTAYSLTVTSLANSWVQRNVTVTVNSLPDVTVTAISPVTNGLNANASVPSQSGATYIWSISGGTITSGTTGSSISYTPASIGTCKLSCSVANIAGTLTGSASVKVVAAPTITSFTSSKTDIVSGGSAVLTPVFSNGSGYISFGVGPVISGSPVTVSPAGTVQYTLTVVNTAGTTVTQAVNVIFDRAPNASVRAISPVTVGTSGFAAASVVDYQPGATYAWSISNGTANVLDSNSLQYWGFILGTCILKCTVTTAAGSATDSTTVTVIAAPTITSFTCSSASISLGSSATLTPVFSGGKAWIDNGAGPVTSGIPVTVSPTINTTYTLTVMNAAGSTTTQTITLNVNNTAAVPITVASPVTTNVTNQQASVPAQSGAAYVWSITNGTIQPGYGSDYYIYYTPGTVGTCTLGCKVTTTSGSLTGSMAVNVIAPPTITSFASDKTDIVAGGSAVLMAVFSNGIGLADQGVGTMNSGVPVTVSPTMSTCYHLTVTNAAGTSVNQSICVYVDSKPLADVSAYSPVTAGASCAALVAPQTGAVYSWSILGGTITSGQTTSCVYYSPSALGNCTLTCKVVTAVGTATGSATVEVISPPYISRFTMTRDTGTGCGYSVLRPIFGNGTGVITPGVGAVVSGVPIVVTPAVATSYQLTVTNRAGTDVNLLCKFSAMTISPNQSTLPPSLSEIFQANEDAVWSIQEGAVGGTIDSSGNYTAPSAQGTYHINAIAQVDASLSATAEVNVQPLVSVNPSVVNLKPSVQQTFKAFVLGGSSSGVTWSLQEGAAGGSITSAGVYTAPTVAGQYHVVASFGGQQDTATVNVGSSGDVSVIVSPAEIDLAKSGVTTFSAAVQNAATGVTWTASGGTIDPATGAYIAPSTFGTYTITATTQDGSGAFGVATVTVKAVAGTDKTFTHDANGNMTSDGTRTMEWDAENRLVAVTDIATGHRSEFGYDFAGRRVMIRELDVVSSTLTETSNKKYLWKGPQIAEERDTTGANVTRRFYQQGFVDSDGTNLYYTMDHLGSIRELTDSTQAVRAGYDYDPYGRMNKISGDKDSVFGYTGDFYHAQSGLCLTKYRAYDPNLGRWISRDPAGILGGIDLYGYEKNNPINYVDRDGRWVIGAVIGAVVGGVAASFDPNATITSVLVGAAIGGLIGALDPTEGILSNALQYGVASGVGNVVGQVINNAANEKPVGCIDLNNALTGAAIGALGGAALGASGDALGSTPGMPDTATDLGSSLAGAVGGMWW